MRVAPIKTILLVAFGCSLFVTGVGAATVQATLKSPSSRGAAPPFRLADGAGKNENLSDYRGKVVVLNFWATDCGGCRLEIPWLADIDRDFKTKAVAVIGIAMDISYEDLKSANEAWAKVKPFATTHQIGYPVLMEDSAVSKSYDIQALPVTYLVDRQGRIAATYVGVIDKQNVEANIHALLAEH